MTIQAEENRKIYNCNGSLTVFTFNFKILEEIEPQK